MYDQREFNHYDGRLSKVVLFEKVSLYLKKMNNLCTVCFSKDRRLYKLENLRSIYDCLVPEVEANLPDVQLCWECQRVLQKSKQFQRNALAARDILIAHTFSPTVDTFGFITGELDTASYSTLTKVTKDNYNFTYTFDDDSTTYCELSPKQEKAKIKYIDLDNEDKAILTPIEIKIEDEHEIDAPMTPCTVTDDPLSDVQETTTSDIPPKFTAVDIKPLPEKPTVLTSVDQVKKLPEGLFPIKTLPSTSAGPGKVLKKIKLPEHVAQQIRLLTAKNCNVKLKIGDNKPRKIVVVGKDESEPVATVVPEKRVVPKIKKVTKIKRKLVKDGKVMKKMMKSVNSATKKPSSEQIYQRFSNMLRNCLSEENRKNVRVRVMTEKEVLECRDNMRKESQYVNSQFKCTSCVMGYYSEQQLEDHNVAKHTERPVDVKCDVCLAYIPTYMFSFHYGRHRVLYSCLLCDHNMTEPKRVKEHMTMHRKPVDNGVYRCNVCGIEFNSRHRRKVHKEKEHAPPENYTCEICGKTFDRRWSWKDHVKRHNLPNEPVECHVCHKTYKSSVSFSMHYRNVHKRDASEKVRCEECDMTFVNMTCLNMHLKYSRKHADPSSFKHICYACGKGFMYERQMKDHINYVHKGQTEHVCKYCDKMYSSAGGLRKHIKFVHEGGTYEKNKVCTICGKSFTSPKSLREHQNIHSGTRPFKCPVCGDTFKQSAALYTHNRLVHLGFKLRGKKVVKVE